MNNRITSVILATILLTLGGCATPIMEQERSGFIGDYSQLEKTSKNTYDYAAPKLDRYDMFLVETPEILFTPKQVEGMAEFSQEELDELADYAKDRIELALDRHDAYSVAKKRGPNVAVVRLGITAADASVGALNVVIYTKLTGAGLGGAALEGEIVDSESGEQLAASIQWGNGSRVLRAGFTKLGDAKLQINRWARNFVKRLDNVMES